MSKSPLEILQPALDKLPKAQREVFDSLTPEELALAASLHERLNAAEPETAGQGNMNNCAC